MEKANAVEISHLVKCYRSSFKRRLFRAVDDVSLQIGEGEVYGLIGPNGSGKSTTMKALIGLVTPTEGSCKVFGAESIKVDSRREIGFLPENPYFYKHQTVAETLKFYGKLCGMHGKELTSRVDELIELVSLENARNRRIGGYSKGMLQRVGLAQALIQKPRLLVLDEPTAGVDPLGSREIRDLILKLKHEGVTIFLCSHLLEQVQEVCDQVGIIFEGKIVQQGTLKELTTVDDHDEIILKGASEELLTKIKQLVQQDAAAEWVSHGKPKTTLERLFIETARKRGKSSK
ncbi:ABC-2 type transport system ATP-binding protein [Rubritalea squalenifaciens DSM 18772]|uniref:ABC-2 type transport system ATP-binding protein n=1 Tax=Rubritalea squalenifaciens DSM 18772 TaxID=1123071 RepID=A0A1M6DUN3_9BACT|nr:ABC transporter ATP-binding protein [Rubritalea squalenifaciens]SHI76901.1 ABC-2 type transport system ATP-binding protein [Rubritalea squalenifaciens DSM 18772]